MKNVVTWVLLGFGAALLANCSTNVTPQSAGAPVVPSVSEAQSLSALLRERRSRRRYPMQWPITNVVIIVQENRTVDNLFQFLPGANTQSWGYIRKARRCSCNPNR